MRATVMFGAGDVRIENVADARIIEATDAVVIVSRACICGSDLWPYKTMEQSDTGRRMGHEAIGVVAAVGANVRTIETGDVVIMPFAYSDGSCVCCHDGLLTSSIHGGFFGTGVMDGAQAEALRVPLADGTLFALPVGKDDALMPSLLTLSDVMGTGHHAAVAAKVARGKPRPWSATAPSACAASLPPGAWAPRRLSSSAAIPTASHSLKSSAHPTS